MKKLLLVLAFTLWVQSPNGWEFFGEYSETNCLIRRVLILELSPFWKENSHLVKCIPSNITPYSKQV